MTPIPTATPSLFAVNVAITATLDGSHTISAVHAGDQVYLRIVVTNTGEIAAFGVKLMANDDLLAVTCVQEYTPFEGATLPIGATLSCLTANPVPVFPSQFPDGHVTYTIIVVSNDNPPVIASLTLPAS